MAYPFDAPAPGYTFANVQDRVTIAITNTNNRPTASAGTDQTVDENSAVVLNGADSSDPDSDTLTYAWVEVGGATVILNGAATATPSFTAPFVGAGGADLTFRLTVDDGYGGTSTDTVVVHVQNRNDPPLASAARPTIASLWPPNHGMVAVGITGVTDPDNNATITITGVTQDEPTNGLGDGDTAIDAVINGDGTVLLRAERAGKGDGRVYRITFTAADLEGSTSGDGEGGRAARREEARHRQRAGLRLDALSALHVAAGTAPLARRLWRAGLEGVPLFRLACLLPVKSRIRVAR